MVSGLSLITALVIQSRGKDIRTGAYPARKKKGHYVGVIELRNRRDRDRWHILVTVNPSRDSHEDAHTAAQKVIDDLRAKPMVDPFADTGIGLAEAHVIETIINASRE